MPNFKIDRTTEDIRRELSDIFRTLKDPRVSSELLSIVRIELTNDMSYCKVYVSAIEGMDRSKEAVRGLKSASGYIRRELALRLHLRHTPELRFIADDSIAHGSQINKLLSELVRSDEDEQNNS
ncbi:MAG: 30S ribosome-binding factor RbfA [Clostridia bacterium]|nr:30S ribosome-binding factor RbfA [Clostridia bacterium]